MIAIAESGSSKTCWVVLDGSRTTKTFDTSGFNPYVQSRELISEIIKSEVQPLLKDHSPEKIFFYGAGCSTEENKKLMYSCFKSFFNLAKIEIEHDMLAAARSLWLDDKGIAMILGTGSNSCIFDGIQIIENIPALGYVLGDEGSGAYMGKKLVADFVYKKLPANLQDKLRTEYQLDKDKVLDKVYKKPNPNRWLASFSFFIRDNIKEEYCQQLLRDSFRAFFENHVSQYVQYKDLPLGAVGSIAWHYKDFLAEVAVEYGCRLEKVVQKPIDELMKYHSREADASVTERLKDGESNRERLELS